MREFMDYVHSAFYEATGWNRENSYAALNSTSDGMRSSSLLDARASLLTDRSSSQLSDAARVTALTIRAREPQLCNLLPAWFRRRRRWLHLIPLLFGAVARTPDAAVREHTTT